MSNDKFRSRVFTLVLYPLEDNTHYLALEKIKKEYNSLFIFHDRDINDKGEIKKNHVHVILKFPQGKWNTALAKELGITPNYIEQVRNYKNACLYLIHYNDSDKIQYQVEEVKGNLSSDLKRFIVDTEESEEQVISKIILEFENFNCVYDIVTFCLQNGYYSYLRRNFNILSTIFYEFRERKKINDRI